MKLTEEQSKIVEDNHDLIYAFIHKNNLDVDEWYDLLAIELCKSVIKHDPSKGKLSTLFYTNAKYLIWHTYRASKTKKRNGGFIYSLEYEYSEGDSVKQLQEIVGDEIYNLESEVEMSIILEKMLSGRYGNIVQMRLDGYSQTEIAEITGYSQAHISRILQDIRGEYFD